MLVQKRVFAAAALSFILILAAAAEAHAQRRSQGNSGRSPSISRSSGARSQPSRSAGSRSSSRSFGTRSSGVRRSPAISSRSTSSRSSVSRSPSPRSSYGASRSNYGSSAGRSSGFNRSSGISSRSSSGSRYTSPSVSSRSVNRSAPYGTSSSPSLYRGSYSRSYRGTTSNNRTPSSFGRSRSSLNSSARLNTRSSAATNRARSAINSNSRSATNRSGTSGSVGYRSGQGTYRTAESYRSGLRSRLDGAGSTTRSGTAGNQLQHRSGAAAGESGGGRRDLSVSAGEGPGAGQRSGGRRGDGDGRRGGGGHHHHHHHHRNNHVDFYFNLGGCGFGLGYYGGHGYYRSSYWDCDWYSWGYRSWYCAPYWYPRYRYCYFPYFWSYSWYPSYRTVYVYESREPYVSSGYLPAAAFDDDPYAEAAIPLEATTASGTTEAIVPLVSGLDAGPTFGAALATGDRLMAAGESLKAAEAYRQAWIHDPSQDALMRMAWALFAAEDYPLASWAMQRFLADGHRQVVIAAALLPEMMNGQKIDEEIAALEKYLVANPNDEGSNLLLGSVYVFAGRAYAGYIILGRLEASGYAPEATKLVMDEARARLGD